MVVGDDVTLQWIRNHSRQKRLESHSFTRRRPETCLYLEYYAKIIAKIVDGFQAAHAASVTSGTKPELASVKLTPFHSALVRADFHLIHDVISQLSDADLTRFAVSAATSSMCGAAAEAFNSGEVFQAHIAHLPPQYRETFTSLDVDGQLHKMSTSSCLDAHLQPHLPLALAALSGDYGLIKLLLRHGADLNACDVNGNNIIHSLVIMCDNDSATCATAVQLLRCIQRDVASSADAKQLGLARNRRGETPLDLAASTGALDMIEALMTWNSVHRFVVGERGPHQHVLYDVSDYESGKSMHLLQYLSFASEDYLEKLSTSSLFKTDFSRTWKKAINEKHSAQTWVWLTVWTLFVLAYGAHMNYYFSARQHSAAHRAGAYCLAAWAVIEIYIQFTTLVRDRHVFKLMIDVIRTRGFAIAFTPIYRAFHLLFSLTVVATEALQLRGDDGDDDRRLFSVLAVFGLVFGTCSMLIFIQLNKVTGHLLVIMERMFVQAAAFMTVGGAIFAIFPMTLHIVHGEATHGEVEDASSSRASNELTFSTTYTSFYETLLLVLGIAVPSPLYFESATTPIFACVIYLIMIFIVSIILINLLIAVMTERVSELNRHTTIIQTIQLISMSLLMERASTRSLVRYVSPFRARTRRVHNKYFVESHDRRKTYLYVIEPVAKVSAATVAQETASTQSETSTQPVAETSKAVD